MAAAHGIDSPARLVKRLARDEGFDLCRITNASPLESERTRYMRWLAAGCQGDMAWMTPERADRSARPATVLPAAHSVISVAMSYWAGHRSESDPTAGKVARYAWGADYHRVMGDRLCRLAEALATSFPGDYRWFVDTGPMMDKALAVRAGIGWYGKNTNVLTTEQGSFVLLGEIITTAVFPPDKPLDSDCGRCRLCMVACPTGALGPEYEIDARKCISYLTIEHRGPVPPELRAAVGNWVFGCDICQDVCPPTMAPFLRSRPERVRWLSDVRATIAGSRVSESYRPAAGPEPDHVATTVSRALFPDGVRQSLDLVRLLAMTHEEYLAAFRGSAIRRAKVWMLRRNAAVALGNVGDVSHVPALVESLTSDEHPIVRGHAAWALGRIAVRHAAPLARSALARALDAEQDASVRREIEAACQA